MQSALRPGFVPGHRRLRGRQDDPANDREQGSLIHEGEYRGLSARGVLTFPAAPAFRPAQSPKMSPGNNMAIEPLLSMRNIDKRFGNVAALIDASLEMRPAEVMGLIGQNGAGKSTMIKVLNGFCSRDSGEIAFAGRPWAASSPQVAQRGGVSTIFQEINLIPFRSVTENIYLGRELRNRIGFLDWRGMYKGAR